MRRQSYGRFLQSEMFHVIMKTTYASCETQQSSKNPIQQQKQKAITPLLTPTSPTTITTANSKRSSTTTRRQSLVQSVSLQDTSKSEYFLRSPDFSPTNISPTEVSPNYFSSTGIFPDFGQTFPLMDVSPIDFCFPGQKKIRENLSFM